MRVTLKTYARLGYAFFCLLVAGRSARAQGTGTDPSPTTCAALLATDERQPDTVPQRGAPGDTARRGIDSASFGVGGARTGDPDIILRAAIHANELRFASQPRVRVRLCWGGDTLRVVQRQNLPSPVVAGTTYRNVFVAVELLGRLNAVCLTERILSGRQPAGQQPRAGTGAAGLGECAFLGGSAAAGQRPERAP